MKYRLGDAVRHRTFGPGKVVGILSGAVVVRFDGLKTARHIRASFEGMEVLK